MERIRFVQCANDSVLVYLGIDPPESTEDFEAASVPVEQERRNRIVENFPGGVSWRRYAFKKGPCLRRLNIDRQFSVDAKK